MGIKPGTSFSIGARELVEQRPEHAALLGGISNAWALLEFELAGFLEILVSLPQLTEERRVIDPIANEFFDAFVLIDHRLSLIRAAFVVRVRDDTLKKELETIFGRIKKASARRAGLIHCAWAVSAQYPDKIIQTKPHRSPSDDDQPFGTKELMEAIRFIDTIHKETTFFFVKTRMFLRQERGAKL